MKNITDTKLIRSMARQPVNDMNIKDDYINLVTVARLSSEKGLDVAINICSKLVRQNYKINWFVVGDGPEKVH
ncbi:glycosyltransferase [Bacillus sp. N9]